MFCIGFVVSSRVTRRVVVEVYLVIGVGCPWQFPLRWRGAVDATARDGGPYVQVSKRTLIEQTYPLTRLLHAFINRPPGQPIEPKLREFLRYLLSRDGQAAVVRDAGYLPLNPQTVATELEKLK